MPIGHSGYLALDEVNLILIIGIATKRSIITLTITLVITFSVLIIAWPLVVAVFVLSTGEGVNNDIAITLFYHLLISGYGEVLHIIQFALINSRAFKI